MHQKIGRFLSCPVCRGSVSFEGNVLDGRFVTGFFKCTRGHVYHVKEQIGLFRDAKKSANEFEWQVNVADEKRYVELRKEYDSYFRDDQKKALQKMKGKLVGYASASSAESDNTVLDIATGMGTFILALAENSPENTLIIGTDIDEKPLRGTMSMAKLANSYYKISLIVTDAKHLCFKSQSFSTLSSNFGFDSIQEAVLAFKESARVLRAGGRIFFSSLWLKENSESMRLAERYHVCQIASEARLKKILGKAGLVLDRAEEMYAGVWPRNPMDLLPVEGDEYAHVIIQARKSRS